MLSPRVPQPLVPSAVEQIVASCEVAELTSMPQAFLVSFHFGIPVKWSHAYFPRSRLVIHPEERRKRFRDLTARAFVRRPRRKKRVGKRRRSGKASLPRPRWNRRRRCATARAFAFRGTHTRPTEAIVPTYAHLDCPQHLCLRDRGGRESVGDCGTTKPLISTVADPILLAQHVVPHNPPRSGIF